MLESAAAARIPVYVLDRAPIGGAAAADGPLLDDALRSFTGYARLPIRFGMTNGELARFLVATRHLATDLRVVAMPRYSRAELGDEPPATFRPPSPNLRNVDEVLLYPGVALLERTNVSVGRGTDRAFELVGAPWIDAGCWLAALRRANVCRGVRVTKATFIPRDGPFLGERCASLGDPGRRSPRALAGRARTRPRRAHSAPRTRPRSRSTASRAMLGNKRAFGDALARGASVAGDRATWQEDLAAFLRARDAALLYPVDPT